MPRLKYQKADPVVVRFGKKVMLLKFKKPLAFLLALLVAVSFVCTPALASSIVTDKSGAVKLIPGSTRTADPEYSKAWLDKLIIRDSASAIMTARLVPIPEYPYSHTFDEFVRDVDAYSVLELLNEDTVGAAYDGIVNVLYYMVAALGMTSDSKTMKKYVKSQNITLPDKMSAEDEIKVAVLYSALKYDAIYTIYSKKVSLPKGITLDSAICIILAELMETSLPSGVDSITGFAVSCMRNYVSQFDMLPVSANADESEIFHWAKVLTAASNDYQVPLTAYDEATTAQKEYVDYAYFASIFKTVYGVNVNPVRLAIADKTAGKTAVPKLLLQSMLTQSGVDYAADATNEELFKDACEAGWFNLEEEFYSDIFLYDLYAEEGSKKIWFTPFALAGQIGGNDEYVKVFLNGKEIEAGKTVGCEISGRNDTIVLKVEYDDGSSKPESSTYRFNVKRQAPSTAGSDKQNSIVADVQNAIDKVVPADNEKVSTIVDTIAQNFDDALAQVPTQVDRNSLTTYASGEKADNAKSDDSAASAEYNNGYKGSPAKSSGGIDFEYLEKLMNETYLSDEEASKAVAAFDSSAAQPKANQTLVQKTVATLKENPEIAAAPTGILALGGLGGYIWTKRKKTSEKSENYENKSKKTED